MTPLATLVPYRHRVSLSGVVVSVLCTLMPPVVFAAGAPAGGPSLGGAGSEEVETGASGRKHAGEAAATPSEQAQEERVRDRVHARWESLISGDLARAYEFETPAFRQATDLDAYRKSFGTAARWSGVDIRDVEFADDGRVATVKLLLSYELALPDGNQYPGRRPLAERWLYKEGDWWIVQQ